jgi:DNA-binding CsgD family transcriptional regulator
MLYRERGLTRSRVRQVPHLSHETAPARGTTGLLRKLLAWRKAAVSHIADRTSREHEIMDLVLAGQPSKNIAVDLGISQRTVENHRASIMKKTGSKSIPALARLVFVVDWIDAPALSLVAESSF